MNPTLLHTLLIVSAVVLIFAAVIVTFVIIANRLAKRSVRLKIEQLRQSGILPNPGSDEDIIRLANEGKREEAALLYVALHGGNLVQAHIRVGVSPKVLNWNTTLMCVILVLMLLTFVTLPRPVTPVLICLFATLLSLGSSLHQFRQARKQVTRNRAALAEGRLPELPARK